MTIFIRQTNKQNFTGILCGLFSSATSIIDWYWNAPLRSRPLTEAELYRYEMFLERPMRVIAPPDFANDWWMVVLFAASMFSLGYMASTLAMSIYKSRLITINNVFLKMVALAGLIIGFSAGVFLLIAAYMFPLVWKINLSVVVGMLTFLGTYLIFRSPYHLYLWLKQKRICT